MRVKVGASILAANFSCLDRELRRIERAGIDFFHVDIMDGNFVANITIGPGVLKDIRKITKLPLDVHLMVKNPLEWAGRFIAAGADMLTFHAETIRPAAFSRYAAQIKKKGIKLGVSLNPGSALAKIKGMLSSADFVLVMSVNPGFGGQKFINSVVPKIKALRNIYRHDIAVDGGIDAASAKKVIAAGANILASGTYIFKSSNPRVAIKNIRSNAVPMRVWNSVPNPHWNGSLRERYA